MPKDLHDVAVTMDEGTPRPEVGSRTAWEEVGNQDNVDTWVVHTLRTWAVVDIPCEVVAFQTVEVVLLLRSRVVAAGIPAVNYHPEEVVVGNTLVADSPDMMDTVAVQPPPPLPVGEYGPEPESSHQPEFDEQLPLFLLLLRSAVLDRWELLLLLCPWRWPRLEEARHRCRRRRHLRLP